MPTVSSGIIMEANLLNLKAISVSEVRREVPNLMTNGEEIVQAFQTVRDQVVFTNKRIFVVNVQGITGKKISYFSYPYSKVQYYGIETAGVLDIDSELILAFSNGARLQFDFKSNVDIRQISNLISQYII
ncbi:MAG: PH domain-containing protein [Erysipelotrichaceae bacterium]|nr:PH domain-containing protein [Erysipelotrichaceae bacterium]